MNILITGVNGYVSRMVGEFLSKKDNITVHYISLRNSDWKNKSFSQYDVIFHSVGAIPGKTVSIDDYYNINEKLTKEVAQKAKQNGVEQFIFLSSMSVYGINPKIKNYIEINENTPCIPDSDYGKSKYQGENELRRLETDSFRVTIIRSPSIYGKNFTAFFEQYTYLLKRLKIQPDGFKNCKRSSLYIENLSELVYLIILNKYNGIICPQDKEALSTVEFVRHIGMLNNTRRIYSKIAYYAIRIIFSRNPIVNNIWGSIAYNPKCSQNFDGKYQIYYTKQAIQKCLESDG